MNIIAITVTLVSCMLMFFVKRETKAAMLIMGAMTLTLVSVPGVPLHKANLLLQVAFLLSEWDSLEWHVKRLIHTPYLWGLLILVSCSTLLAALTSSYVSILSFLQNELLFKYFALAYSFWAVKDAESLKPVLRVSLYCLIVLTIFGLLNYISGSAAFVNALTEGKTSNIHEGVALGDVFTDDSRFRVQSMFKFPFDYGYICVLMLLLHLYGKYRGLEKWWPFMIAVACCLFGVGICGCRIIWVCCFLAVSCFYVWCFPLNRTTLFGIIAICAFIFSYSTIEAVEKKVDQVTDIFKENPNTKGSSIELRMGQFARTIYYIQGHELLGRGQGYWATSRSQNINNVQGLQGIESVVFQHLLERGIIGFVLWIAFYGWLFFLFWSERKQKPLITGLGVSIWVAYMFFAVGTGELGSVYPTLLLLGMTLKVIDYSQRKNMLISLLLSIIDSKRLTKKQHLGLILKVIKKVKGE